VAGFLGPAWLPWGRDRSPSLRVAAGKAWPVSWTPRGCFGGVAGPLGPAWPQW